MAPFVARAVGIDVAPKMLEQARRLAIEQGASNCDFVEGSGEKIPFEDGQFNLVTARHAPHHFRNIDRFLAEVCRVLTPGRRFVMVDQISPVTEVAEWVDIGSEHGIRPILSSEPSSNGWRRRRQPVCSG